MDSKKLKFVSSSTVYEENNGAIVVASSPSMIPNSRHIYVKYHWFKQNVEKGFLIWKTEYENQKANIFTKGLQGDFFSRSRKLPCSWQAFG